MIQVLDKCAIHIFECAALTCTLYNQPNSSTGRHCRWNSSSFRSPHCQWEQLQVHRVADRTLHQQHCSNPMELKAKLFLETLQIEPLTAEARSHLSSRNCFKLMKSQPELFMLPARSKVPHSAAIPVVGSICSFCHVQLQHLNRTEQQVKV